MWDERVFQVPHQETALLGCWNEDGTEHWLCCFCRTVSQQWEAGLGEVIWEQLLDWSKVWGEWLKAVAKLTNRKTINTVTTAAEESC